MNFPRNLTIAEKEFKYFLESQDHKQNITWVTKKDYIYSQGKIYYKKTRSAFKYLNKKYIINSKFYGVSIHGFAYDNDCILVHLELPQTQDMADRLLINNDHIKYSVIEQNNSIQIIEIKSIIKWIFTKIKHYSFDKKFKMESVM
jgi:hypothetical protein